MKILRARSPDRARSPTGRTNRKVLFLPVNLKTPFFMNGVFKLHFFVVI
jgi:hypothetical protein